MAVSFIWADSVGNTSVASAPALRSQVSNRFCVASRASGVWRVVPFHGIHTCGVLKGGCFQIQSCLERRDFGLTELGGGLSLSDKACSAASYWARSGLVLPVFSHQPTKAIRAYRREPAAFSANSRIFSVRSLGRPSRNASFNSSQSTADEDSAAALPGLDVLEDIFDAPSNQSRDVGAYGGQQNEVPELGLLEELLSETPAEECGVTSAGGDSVNSGGVSRRGAGAVESVRSGVSTDGSNGAVGKRTEAQHLGRGNGVEQTLRPPNGGSPAGNAAKQEGGNDWSNSALEEALRTATEEKSAKEAASELSFESLIDAGAVGLFVEDGRIERLPIEEVLGEEVKAFVTPHSEGTAEETRFNSAEGRRSTSSPSEYEARFGASQNVDSHMSEASRKGEQFRGEKTPRLGVWRAPKGVAGQKGGTRLDTRVAKAPGAWAQWLESGKEPVKDAKAEDDVGGSANIRSKEGSHRKVEPPVERVVDGEASADISDWDSDGRSGRVSGRGLGRGFQNDTGFQSRDGYPMGSFSDGSDPEEEERRRGALKSRMKDRVREGLSAEESRSAKRVIQYETLSPSELFGADPFGGPSAQPKRTPDGREAGVGSSERGQTEATGGGVSRATGGGGDGATVGSVIEGEGNSLGRGGWDGVSSERVSVTREGFTGSERDLRGSADGQFERENGNGRMRDSSARGESYAFEFEEADFDGSGSRGDRLRGRQVAVRSGRENGLSPGLDDGFQRRHRTPPPVVARKTTEVSLLRKSGDGVSDGLEEGFEGGFQGAPQAAGGGTGRSNLGLRSDERLPKTSRPGLGSERGSEPSDEVSEKQLAVSEKRVKEKERAWEAWQQYSRGQNRSPQEMQDFLARWAAENADDGDSEPDYSVGTSRRSGLTAARSTYDGVSARGDNRAGFSGGPGYILERSGIGKTEGRGTEASSRNVDYAGEGSTKVAGFRDSKGGSNRPGKDVWVSPRARNASETFAGDAAPGDSGRRDPSGRFTGVQERPERVRLSLGSGRGTDVSRTDRAGADETSRVADVESRRADLTPGSADVDPKSQRARRRESVESLRVLSADGWGASEGADLDWVGDDQPEADTWTELEVEDEEEDEFVQPTETEWQQVLEAGAAARRARWAAQEEDPEPEAPAEEEEESPGDISRMDLEALSEEEQKDLLLRTTINLSVRNRVQHWRDSRLKKKPREYVTMEERGFAKFVDILPELERQKLLCQKVKAGKLVWAPCCVFYVIHHSHTEILRFFNARTRALARQWKLSYVATRALNYYMRSSCCLTLAIKNQLKSRAAAYKKFGRELTDPVTRAKFDMKTPIPKGGWDTIDADRPVGVRAVGGGYYTPEEMRVRSRMVPQPITWQVPTLEDPTMGGRWDLGVDTPERLKGRKRPEDRNRDRKFGGWSSSRR